MPAARILPCEKGYDRKAIRLQVEENGMMRDIPPKPNRLQQDRSGRATGDLAAGQRAGDRPAVATCLLLDFRRALARGRPMA